MPSKILVLSDTHLTHLPDRRKLEFLLNLVRNCDRVILNGDFWDGYLTSFSRFIFSPAWQPLFKVLREKEALYIHGNHDLSSFCTSANNPFCVREEEKYEFEQGGQRFHIEHGHQLAPTPEITHPGIPRPILGLASLADNVCFRLFQERFLGIYRANNITMREWQKTGLEPKIYLLCGHSHVPELNKAEYFANSGAIRGGFASYLTIEDGTVSLHKTSY